MSIQKQTRLKVTDNSGALEIMCFHIIGSTKKRTAMIGDTIIGAVKKGIPGGVVKKGDKVTAVVVRSVQKVRRSDGSYIGFGDNAVVILKDKKEQDPKGTRIFGPIAREVRERGFIKIVSLATGGVV